MRTRWLQPLVHIPFPMIGLQGVVQGLMLGCAPVREPGVVVVRSAWCGRVRVGHIWARHPCRNSMWSAVVAPVLYNRWNAYTVFRGR